ERPHHAGRLDDHPAADQDTSARRRSDVHAQDQGSDPRRRGDADLQQVPDSRDVFQPDLFREPGLRPQGGGRNVLRRHRSESAYRGGYNVYTSIDWNMQQLAEKEVRQHVDALKGSNVNNAALITMDPTTGEILAYVGSYDYYMHTPQVQGDYDHAGIAFRQPG